MAWKYVMLKSGNFVFPVIFPDKLVHSDVAQVMKCAVHQCLPNEDVAQVISAGSIDHVELVNLGGESMSLNVRSRGEVDKHAIELYSYVHGIE